VSWFEEEEIAFLFEFKNGNFFFNDRNELVGLLYEILHCVGVIKKC
jgi:hypothetical protein